MRQQQALLNISELLSRFKFQVGILNAVSMLDINVIAEDFLIPVLNEIYNCDLKNANAVEKNYPAIDLIDQENRIAIQVTSTSSSEKVRKTLEKIEQNQFFESFDKFKIIIISSRMERYSTSMIEKATDNKFEFKDEDIIDVEGLFKIIKSITLEKILTIEQILKNQYTDSNYTNSLLNENLDNLTIAVQNYQNGYLSSKLEAAINTRGLWLEKKSYFEYNLPVISDINQKFTIEKQIAEFDDKIKKYEDEILEITCQLESHEY